MIPKSSRMPNNVYCRDVIMDGIDLFNQVITLEVYRYVASDFKKSQQNMVGSLRNAENHKIYF